ncbi:DUF2933 domain-containing protein [Myxosarcina sp. GI1(2024)]
MVRNRITRRWQSPYTIVLLVSLGIGTFWLVTMYWSHLVTVSPWLFLLLCPLMHSFMHGSYKHNSRVD